VQTVHLLLSVSIWAAPHHLFITCSSLVCLCAGRVHPLLLIGVHACRSAKSLALGWCACAQVGSPRADGSPPYPPTPISKQRCGCLVSALPCLMCDPCLFRRVFFVCSAVSPWLCLLGRASFCVLRRVSSAVSPRPSLLLCAPPCLLGHVSSVVSSPSCLLCTLRLTAVQGTGLTSTKLRAQLKTHRAHCCEHVHTSIEQAYGFERMPLNVEGIRRANKEGSISLLGSGYGCSNPV